MSKTLVIVESPGKIKKINEYLGSEYIVKASIGHIQDLDKKTMSIDIENNFKPNYIISPDKKNVVKDLKDFAAKCKGVLPSLFFILQLIVLGNTVTDAVINRINHIGIIKYKNGKNYFYIDDKK